MSQSRGDDVVIYNTEDGKSRVDLLVQHGDVWLTQKQLAELFSSSIPNIITHIKHILEEKELDADSVTKFYLVTADDGKKYQVKHYSLDMILAIGFRVRSKRGVQFRRWANSTLREYLDKGFLLDDERLKTPQGRVDYFDELLARIRDIRASEMRFYQKVRDLFSLSSDYDATDKETRMFFAEAQNKLLYAATGQTASELICSRADGNAPNMGLTTWSGKKVRKGDIVVAKNYLSEEEIDTLNRLTVIFLDSAELQVKRRKDLTLEFWQSRIDSIIGDNGFDVLEGAGQRSRKQMETHTETQYEVFTRHRLEEMQAQADRADEVLLMELESTDIFESNAADNGHDPFDDFAAEVERNKQ